MTFSLRKHLTLFFNLIYYEFLRLLRLSQRLFTKTIRCQDFESAPWCRKIFVIFNTVIDLLLSYHELTKTAFIKKLEGFYKQQTGMIDSALPRVSFTTGILRIIFIAFGTEMFLRQRLPLFLTDEWKTSFLSCMRLKDTNQSSRRRHVVLRANPLQISSINYGNFARVVHEYGIYSDEQTKPSLCARFFPQTKNTEPKTK